MTANKHAEYADIAGQASRSGCRSLGIMTRSCYSVPKDMRPCTKHLFDSRGRMHHFMIRIEAVMLRDRNYILEGATLFIILPENPQESIDTVNPEVGMFR